ncbi:MAG: hypothetical protein GYA14_04570 [Ignavibacteria bacterium]|nr:hypothetical protein [Ignavibacteria bacterium]
MQKYKNQILIMLFSILLLSCAPTDRFTFVAPEYKRLNQSGVEILVMPFISTLFDNGQLHDYIERKNKSKETLTAKEIELLENYVPILLAENSFAKITRAEKKDLNTPIKFQYVNAEIGDTSKKVFVPEIKNLVYDEIMPKYLFFVEDAFFNKTGDEKGVSMGRGSESFFVFDAGIEYLLWDNHQGKIAAFGKLQAKQKLLSLPNKESYLAILETFIVDFLKDSPLAQKKIYF